MDDLEIDKLRKRIKRQAEKNIDIDDSDIPIHEKLVREEHIKENLPKTHLFLSRLHHQHTSGIAFLPY